MCMTPRANASKMLASGGGTRIVSTGARDLCHAGPPHARGSDGTGSQQDARAGPGSERRILEGRTRFRRFSTRKQGITQIFVGHNLRRTWRARLGGTPLDRLIRDAEGIDVRVFPQ